MDGELQRGGVKLGVDSHDCRKKRQEHAVQIRRARREDTLRKRRATGQAESSEATKQTESAIPVRVTELPRMLAAVRSADPAERLSGTVAVRKLLSRPSNPPVQEVIDAGFLPVLCEMLKAHDHSKLQFEAAWALTNIGSSDLTSEVVNAGAVPLLSPLLRSSDESVREQAAWCLGNVAGDCSEYRDLILGQPDLLEGLLLNLQHPGSLSMLRNVTWAVSNLCRGNKPKPDLEKLRPLIPILAQLIQTCGDEDTIVDATWALSYVSDGDNPRLDAIVGNPGLLETLVQILQGKHDKCVAPCLRTLGNIVTGTEQHTQAAIDAGLLPQLTPLFEHAKTSLRKEAAWTASNVTAGTQGQIEAVLATPGLMEAIVSELEHGEWQVRKEAAWTVANVCTGGREEHVRCLAERHNVLAPLSDMLRNNESRMTLVVLGAIEAILRVDSDHYGRLLQECGGLDELETLQEQASDEVYEKARTIVETFFSDEDEEDDQNLAPNATTEAFSFGKPSFDVAPPQQPVGAGGFNFSSFQ